MAEFLTNPAANNRPISGRADRLAVFLRRHAAMPFCYGTSDCALMPADWCAAECGIDPAWPVRGLYAAEADWQHLADAEGGLVDLWRDLGIRAGLQETADPIVGDIGLVEIADLGIFGAIKMTTRWIVKLDRGITASNRFKPVASWRVPA